MMKLLDHFKRLDSITITKQLINNHQSEIAEFEKKGVITKENGKLTLTPLGKAVLTKKNTNAAISLYKLKKSCSSTINSIIIAVISAVISAIILVLFGIN